MKKYKKGFTAGTFDLFHVGHLNLLNNAKVFCDYLIVGVNDDQLVYSYKNKTPLINVQDRLKIISNIKAVDKAIIMYNLDKVDAFKKFEFDVVFIGDDWKGSPRWIQTEKDLKKFGVDVIYIPYTSHISSTKIANIILRKNEFK